MKKNTLLTARRSKMLRRLQTNMGKRGFAGVAICALMIMTVATTMEVYGHPFVLKQLTFDPGVDTQPCWAPSWQICFVSNRSGPPPPSPNPWYHTDVWVMNGEGKGQLPVTNSTARGSIHSGLSWNHDSTRIVFCRTDNEYTIANDDICTVDGVPYSEPSVTFIYTSGDTETPDWSLNGTGLPFDGGRIAMTASECDWQICTINSTGHELAQITNFADCPDPYICRFPDWSPDCNKIVFEHQRNSPDTHELWIVDVSPGHSLPVAPGPYLTKLCDGETPEWSPDGKFIVFNRKSPITGIYGIWLTDLAAEWPLMVDPEISYALPTWSPDGSEIAFVSNKSGNADIWKLSWKPVGGIFAPIDKLGLLTPYIGLASVIVVATAATSIYTKRIKHRKEKQ